MGGGGTIEWAKLCAMRNWLVIFSVLCIAGCGSTWNDPYPASDRGKSILYLAFTERPRHLDPARSYSEDEASINAQIYEPPLQYHYLKRPYTLVPLTAAAVPHPQYYDAQNRLLPQDADAKSIAYSLYEIRLKPGIHYQPHPAFARDADGKLLYQNLTRKDLESIDDLADFRKTGTRELVASDYVYEIKRLADPRIQSPIAGLMSEYILGFREFSQRLQKDPAADLSKCEMSGVEARDRYTYTIKVRGKYPQFAYWLAMSFFAPLPPEVDHFYSQPGMAGKNLVLDWHPVGTGPYMLTENNPNSRMVLMRNPNFHSETYPSSGMPGDEAVLKDAGKTLPFIDRVVFSREKESIPYWNKFLQGYYDVSGITSDNFDQAIMMSVQGEAQVSKNMAKQGIELKTSVAPSIRYMAFNMLDPVVGGNSRRARLLRQAISIALDFEENISIFANGRGIPAQGPLPPGIFGYHSGQEGINPVVYEWADGEAKRKSIMAAKKLLVDAGYPDGRDAATGKPLVLYLDSTGRGADDKTRFDWYRKEFARINIQLEVRATDYNRFQEKIRKGSAQIFTWGWNADYPDPENFLFLLYGPQGKVKYGGENSANYDNPEYDRLFEKMKNMENSPQRQAIIDRMVAILREDSPWMWGFYPKDYQLNHIWLSNLKPNQMARNNVKYLRIDAKLRDRMRREWNRPVLWPIAFAIMGLGLIVVPALRYYRSREEGRAK